MVPTKTTTTTTTTTNLEKLVAKAVRRNIDRNELSKSVRNELSMTSHSEKYQNELSNPHTKISSSLSNIGSNGKAINNLFRARHKNKISQNQKMCARQHDTARQHDI